MNEITTNYLKYPELSTFSAESPAQDPPTSPEASICTDQPSKAQTVFRRILNDKPAQINRTGEIRFKSFEESLKSREVEITSEERSCLIEVFSQFKNQSFDYPLHILMLSLNQDFNKALKDPSIGDELKERIGKYQKFLASKCIEFCHEVRNQNFLSVFDLSSKDPISKFQKTIDLTFSTIESMFPDHLLDKVRPKQKIFNKLLSVPDFYTLGMQRFSSNEIEEGSEENKGQEQLIPSMSSIQRIDSARSDFLTEEEMIDFLLDYTEWLQNYYKSSGSEGMLISDALTKLKKINELIHKDPVEARTQRTILLSLLSQKKRELSVDLNEKQSRRYLQKLAAILNQNKDKFLTKAKELSNLCDFDLILDRMIVSLDTLIDKQTLILISKRLLSNLETLLTHPLLADQSNNLNKIDSDFLNLSKKIKCLIPASFMKKSKDLLAEKFDALTTPITLQELCLKWGKKQFPDTFTNLFKQIHLKYSRQAQELKKLDRQEELEKLVKTYTSNCTSLLPLFFCLQDIQNLRNDTLADEEDVVSDQILDCFELDLEIESLSIEPSNEEVDKDSLENSPPTQETDSSPAIEKPPIAPPLAQTAPIAPSIPAPSITITPQILPEVRSRPNSSISTEDSPVRIPKNLKRRKLKQFLKNQFGLKSQERTRHTGIYSNEGKMITLVSRGSRDIPRGTLSGMNKKLSKQNEKY